jgi:RNA polymerase sigma factor (sigma-70 family)
MLGSTGAGGTPEEVLPDLMRSLHSDLRRILARHGIPYQDGGDLVQTTLLILLSKWNEVRSPRGWLIGVLENRCILYWRRRRLEEQRTLPLDSCPQPLIDGDQRQREVAMDMARLARGLPERDRRIVAMRYQLGMTDSAVAKRIGLRPASIRKAMHRALAQMRRESEAFGRRRARRPASQDPLSAAASCAAALSWPVAVRAFLASMSYARSTRLAYATHLLRAESTLGFRGFDQLAGDHLAAYRAVVAARPGQSGRLALGALRGFLTWTGALGLHGLADTTIRETLRPPGAQRATLRGRPPAWRQGPMAPS